MKNSYLMTYLENQLHAFFAFLLLYFFAPHVQPYVFPKYKIQLIPAFRCSNFEQV